MEFYRGWVDYEKGFGNLTGEFWLGLNFLNRITAISSTAAGNELRVDLKDFDGYSAYAKYGKFSIGDSTDKYRLTVSDYSGTTGDSLAWFHNGYQFSTKDQDNDACSSCNCAQQYEGAWWYRICHHSSLNGVYLGGPHPNNARGVVWNSWTGYYYSLKSAEMKLRRQ